jgi:hypothetical protein
MYRFLIMLMYLSVQATAQTAVPFNSPRWNIKGEEAVQETHLGKPALRLKKGAAVLKDANFRNGIIEFDIALSKARYFPAIDFRMQDELNYEEYYLRPHQSGNPDAMQYTPVYNGLGGWQLYYGAGYNNPVELPFGRWLHVKLVVKDRQAEVFFDDGAAPVLFMYHLKRDVAAGMIALSNGYPAVAWYSNFVYTPTDDVSIKSKAAPVAPLPPGSITEWQVSNVFAEKDVTEKLVLQPEDTASLRWQRLQADANGITDLAMLAGVAPEKNTVFVRKTVYAEKTGIQKLSFGFSDRARVYLNGRLVYAGEDNFMSRDYRFLGTVGYWDAVYLDLRKGPNEIWIAVSENFGGWGVKAKLE